LTLADRNTFGVIGGMKKGTAFTSGSFHGNKCQKPKSDVFALIKVGAFQNNDC
jgi:hypothetical protein